jgi:molecular chaperone HscA
VNEPTAASLAYGFGTNQQDAKTIVVYDLGGGTFDVSILRLEQGVFEVLSTNGDTFLGGDDIDRGIVEFWNAKYQLLSAEDLKNKQKVQSLKALAEQAKKLLSSQRSVELVYEQQVLQIMSADFELIVQKIIQKTLACCKRALEDAELSKNEIDEVIMVGGSTRIGLIKSAVADFFGKEVNDRVNPDEIVALGAAIQADILAGNQKDSLLLDITPLSLGIETLGGLMDTIIGRNSKIPTSMARQYTTSVDGQKNLKVAIYQGERELVAHNRLLGELVLKGIPPMPAGLPKIEIQFLLNADGILQVKAKELRSGVETSIEIRSTYGISGEQMGKMLLDSVKNAATDMQMRGLIEAQTEAQGVLLATTKFLKQNTAILTQTQTEEIQRLAETLQMWIEKGDKHQILSAMDALNAYAAPIAQIAMDNLIGASMKGSKIGE